MVLKKEISLQIKNLLKKHPQGLRITDIVKKVNINRNTAGRYLENLLVSGQVEMRRFGMAKIYTLSQRVPLSALLSISSELVLQLDSSLRIIYANEPFLLMVETDNKSLFGKNIEFSPIALVFEDFFTEFIENLRDGVQGKEWSGQILLRSKNITWFCRIAPTVFDDGRKGVSVILEDITERKFAESSLRESEDRFRKLVEISPDGVFIHQQGKILFINAAALKILGASQADDIIGKSVLDLIHPDFRDTVRKNIEKDLSGEITPPLELHLLRQDGATIIVEGRGVKTTLGGIPAVQVAIRDITDRKRIEMELRESEEKYRTFIDRANDGIVVVQDGIIKICNRSIIEFWGGSTSDIIGKNFMEFIRPDVLPDIVNRYKQRIAGEKIPPLYETVLKRKDGSNFFAELNAGLISFEGQTADLVIIRDINERKKIEENLRKSEYLYRTLAEAANDLIFIIDRNDRVEYVNIFASKMVNKIPEQIIGQPRSSLFPPDVVEHQKKALTVVFDKGESTRSEGALIFGDQIRWFDHYLTPLRDDDNHVRSVLGISRDITARRRMEEELHESEEKYRTLVERANDVICIIQEGIVKMCNPRFPEYWGGSMGEIIGKNISDFVHPDCLPTVIKRYKQRIAGENPPLIYESIFIRKDGSKSFVELNAGIISYEGKPADLIIVRDINERKNSESKLRESDLRLRLILDNTEDLIIVQDTQGRYIYFNLAARYGVPMETATGLTPYDFLDRASADHIVERVKTIAKTGQSMHEETPVIWNSQKLWFSDSLSPIKDANGTVTGVVTISQNITERKRAEIALQESEATARALINAPTDSVLLIDDQGMILALNEIAVSRFGKRGDELVGTMSYDLLPKEIAQLRRTLMAPVLEKKEVVRFMDERAGRWYDTVAYPILNETGEVKKIAIIARDITEQKTFEMRLLESEQMYKRLLEQTFDATVVHKEGKITFLNDRAMHLLGASSPLDLIGRSIRDFIHPDSLQDIENRLQKLSANHGMPVPVLKERFFRLDGTTITAEVMAISFFENGIPAVRVVLREISPP